jgi:hypothetical protein
MIIGRPIKQPIEVQDYDIDFDSWLPAGDSISSAVIGTPTGITLDSFSVSSPIVKIWVAGGTAGSSYKFQITVTTNVGRVKQTELIVKVKEY